MRAAADLERIRLALENPSPYVKHRRHAPRRHYDDLVSAKNEAHVFITAARDVAVMLENEGHLSSVRIPPSDLAALVKRGNNA